MVFCFDTVGSGFGASNWSSSGTVVGDLVTVAWLTEYLASSVETIAGCMVYIGSYCWQHASLKELGSKWMVITHMWSLISKRLGGG